MKNNSGVLNFKIAQQLLEFAASQFQRTHNKYDPILDELRLVKRFDSSCQYECLVVGGGNCIFEVSIIQSLMKDFRITSLDKVQPTPKRDPLEIDWVNDFAPDGLSRLADDFFDLIICLGTSRYFLNPKDTLFAISKKAKLNSIVVFDVMKTAPIKSACNSILRNYLCSSISLTEAKVKLRKISEFFCDFSKILDQTSMRTEVEVEELGFFANLTSQQLIYDSIMQIWNRDGSSIEETEVMILWQIMCFGELPQDLEISEFTVECGLQLRSVLQLNSNTTVVIADKSTS